MRKILVAAIVLLCVAVWATAALAQTSPPVLVVDDHVLPGMGAQWEEARREQVAFLTEHGFPFLSLVLVSDDGIYRTVTQLEEWDDMNRRAQWAADSGFFSQEFWHKRTAVTTRRDQSFRPSIPDLGYRPDNPRVSQDEEGFIRERRYFLRTGTNAEAAEIRADMRALHEQHNIRNGYFVVIQTVGADGPIMSVFMTRRDAADWYAQAVLDTEAMGDEIRELRRRMNQLARRAVWVNWTPHQDLQYAPSGQ